VIHSGPWNGTVKLAIRVVPPTPCLIGRMLSELTQMHLYAWHHSDSRQVIAGLQGIDEHALFRAVRMELTFAQDFWRGRLSFSRRDHLWMWMWRAEQFEIAEFASQPAQLRKQLAATLREAALRLGAGRCLPVPPEPSDPKRQDLPSPADRPDK
jgi:hypothetical protein